jgi:hypothetical protein
VLAKITRVNMVYTLCGENAELLVVYAGGVSQLPVWFNGLIR